MANAKMEKLSLEELLKQALIKDADRPYEVPKNWIWIKFKYIVQDTKLGLVRSSKEQSNMYAYNYLKMNNISNNGELVLSNLVNVEATDIEVENFSLKLQDFLFNTRNSRELVGKNTIVKKDFDKPMLFNNNIMRVRFTKFIKPQIVSYYLNSPLGQLKLDEVKKVTTNVAAIYTKDLNNIAIPILPIKEQQRIVVIIESLFEKLDTAKELAQNALDSFENRKTAILHKAFIGELTTKWRKENWVSFEAWEEKELKELCTINPKKIDTKNVDDDTNVTFVPMHSVSDILGRIEMPLVKKLREVKKGYTNFSENDVLFAKITPCMENGKSAIVGKLVNDIGFGSTEFHVFRCGDKLYNRYLYNLIRSQLFLDKAKAVMTGAVGQQRVPKTFLDEYILNTPSIEEQKEIVRIVDNLLGNEQQAKDLSDVIEKIDLMKKAILARAFRGELGTNNPEEESIVELLKEVLKEKL